MRLRFYRTEDVAYALELTYNYAVTEGCVAVRSSVLLGAPSLSLSLSLPLRRPLRTESFAAQSTAVRCRPTGGQSNGRAYRVLRRDGCGARACVWFGRGPRYPVGEGLSAITIAVPDVAAAAAAAAAAGFKVGRPR